jgi:hypothetical protein
LKKKTKNENEKKKSKQVARMGNAVARPIDFAPRGGVAFFFFYSFFIFYFFFLFPFY